MPKPPPRLYLNAPLKGDAPVALAKEQSHYLTRVLRLKPDDTVLVFNGVDGEWAAQLISAQLIMPTHQTRPQSATPAITLAFALLKNTPTAWLVEKASELGVAALQPLLTERTTTRQTNLDRLQKIAVEAAEQCNRLDVPAVLSVQSLPDFLKHWHPINNLLYSIFLYCDEQGDAPLIQSLAIKTLFSNASITGILIGPEGGFTPAERALIRAHKSAQPVFLGDTILRAETAAITALAISKTLL